MFANDVPLSDCCGYPPTVEGIHDSDGLCSSCKEHTEFYEDEGIKVLEW